MAALKSVEPVYPVRAIKKLRKLYDEVDTHCKSLYWGQSYIYSMEIMRDLMKKFPRTL